MFKLVLLVCLLVCSCSALLPLGLGYSGYAAPLAYNAAPLAYNAAPLAYGAGHLGYGGAFPTYQTVSHSVDVAAEPVEQHGYVVKY